MHLRSSAILPRRELFRSKLVRPPVVCAFIAKSRAAPTMTSNDVLMDDKKAPDTAGWKQVVVRYQKPAVWRGVWQVLNTLVPYAGLWCLMYFSLRISILLAVPLAILAGGFM